MRDDMMFVSINYEVSTGTVINIQPIAKKISCVYFLLLRDRFYCVYVDTDVGSNNAHRFNLGWRLISKEIAAARRVYRYRSGLLATMPNAMVFLSLLFEM